MTFQQLTELSGALVMFCSCSVEVPDSVVGLLLAVLIYTFLF